MIVAIMIAEGDEGEEVEKAEREGGSVDVADVC